MTRTRKLIIAAGIAAVVSGGGVAIATAATQQDPDPPELDRASEVAREAVGDGVVTAVEQDDDGGYDVEVRRADGTETDVDLDRSLQVTRTEDDGADAGDDANDDAPLDEATRAQAAEAALASVASGTVTEVESDDGGYEVEVRQRDGRETEVHLDRDFAVVTTQTDTDD